MLISKEGHTENVDMLIDLRYQGKPLDIGINEIIAKCGIPMPVDKEKYDECVK